MTNEELVKKVVNNLFDEILNNAKERGYFLSDEEKEEIYAKGGLL